MKPYPPDDDIYKISVDFRPMEEIQRKIAEALKHDTDQKVRKALIELGWTPPPVTP